MKRVLEQVAEGMLTQMSIEAVAELGRTHGGLIGAACEAEVKTRQLGDEDAMLEAEELAEETRLACQREAWAAYTGSR